MGLGAVTGETCVALSRLAELAEVLMRLCRRSAWRRDEPGSRQRQEPGTMSPLWPQAWDLVELVTAL